MWMFKISYILPRHSRKTYLTLYLIKYHKEIYLQIYNHTQFLIETNNPNFKIQPNTIIQGDCLNVMKYLPDHSIDMILTDPPYGTTQCKWDSIIPLDLMWNQLKRIIKPNGAIVMTASQPFTSILVNSNLQMFKYDWVWHKSRPTGVLNAKKQHLS